MRDMLLGAVILTWTFVAAHVATGSVAGVFGMVHASLEHVLVPFAHLG